MIGRGHGMSHWSSWDSSRGSVCTLGQFGLFFSCQLVCPSNASILSHNHDFLNFCWSATISLTFETHVIQTLLQRFPRDSWINCRWCCTMLAIAWSAFLNAVYHNIWLCWVPVPLLVAGFSSSISWYTKCIGNTWQLGPYSLNFLRWSVFLSSLQECHTWLATWNFGYSGDRQ